MSAALKEISRYYVSSNIPKIFIEADRQVYGLTEPDTESDSNDNNITDMKDFKKKKDKSEKKEETPKKKENNKKKKKHKEEKRKEIDRKKYEIEMIQMIAQVDYLKHKLLGLNPGRKKDARKIAAINVALMETKERISELEVDSGISIHSLDNGTRLGRFVNKLKMIRKRIVKKTKRFFKHNSELIIGVSSVIIPFVITGLMKIFQKK